MDLAERARNLVTLATQSGIQVRLLGGVALYILAPSARNHPVLKRGYKDIDCVVPRRDGGKLAPVFKAAGFEPDKRFNALHGETRLLFTDQNNPELQVDVFVGLFEQCHKLDILSASEHMPFTITPTQLLLTKLQIVQLNEKDVRDLVTMLLDWPLGEGHSGIDQDALARIFGTDWGLYTTSWDTLEKLKGHASDYLSENEQGVVDRRIEEIQGLMAACPKAMKFRVRDRIGRKVIWYQIPEEVNR